MHCLRSRNTKRLPNASTLAAVSLSCALTLAPGRASTLATWPKVQLPADAQVIDVGREFLSNGMPTRAVGFISQRSTSAVADWFKRNPATTWSVERMQDATVLGRAQGQHFITIKLTPLRDGTRGLMSIVDLAKAAQEQARLQVRLKQWLSELPPGTQLINHVASNDAGRLSEHLVLVNQQSEALNIRSVSAVLVRQGFAVERTLDTSQVNTPHPAAVLGSKATPGQALLFKYGMREAVAFFFRGEAGQSVITINTVIQEKP